MKLVPAPVQPAGFVLVDFAQRQFYHGYMLRMMYGDWRITHCNTWQELEASPGLNGRYLVQIENGAAYERGTGMWLPLDLKETYK